MAVSAVILDVDGTLVDSVDLHAWAWQEAFRRFGREIPYADIRGQIGKGGDQLMPVFLPGDEVERRGEEIEGLRKRFYKAECLPLVRPFPGVRPLFERIRAAGQRIVLASSGTAEEVEHYQRLADVADLVEAATTSDEAERSKPYPDIFQAAVAKLGSVAPADAVVVGDTPYDAEAAAKAGLEAIGVLCGGFPEVDLRAAGCVAIYAGPEELLERYDESPLAR